MDFHDNDNFETALPHECDASTGSCWRCHSRRNQIAVSWPTATSRIVRGVSLVVLLTTALASSACSRGNPILGKWRVDPQASSPEARVVADLGMGEIEFLSDKVMIGSTGVPVTYQFDGASILVTVATNNLIDKYIVVDGNHIRRDLPFDQKLVFARVQ